MKINLYLSFYKDKNPERQKELETCFMNNFNSEFTEIWLFIEQKDSDYTHEVLDKNRLSKMPIVHIRTLQERPKFNEYIRIANQYSDDRLHVVQNSDIYIDTKNLDKIKDLSWETKLFLGLSRWDETKSNKFIHLDRVDSQDVFIWQGKTNVNIPYPMGFCGIDNRVSWEFNNLGYKVVNPSKDIMIKHLHLTKGNNYRENGNGEVIANQICPEPYYFYKPIKISEI